MNDLHIEILYSYPPDSRFGVGGVRKYLTDFTRYLDENHVEWRFLTLLPRPVGFRPAAFIAHLVLSFVLATRLIFNLLRQKHGIIYNHDPIYCGIASMLASKVLKIPIVHHCHNLPSIQQNLGTMKSPFSVSAYFLSFIERLVLRRASTIIVTNSALANHVATVLGSRENIFTLPMGVNIRLFRTQTANANNVREELGISNDKLIIGSIGRLSAVKNLRGLVAAFSSVIRMEDHLLLLIVGDGPQRSILEKDVRACGLESIVVFTGYRDDVPRILQAIDIFVLASFSEGSPIALFEAMASGRCIIASDLPGIQDVSMNGEDIVLFNPNSTIDLSRCLLELCSNPVKRARLAKNAARNAQAFDHRRVFLRALSLLHEASLRFYQ